jgi:hypothetical protein
LADLATSTHVRRGEPTLPRRICICTGCPGCNGRSHTYDKDSSPGKQRCAPCQAQNDRARYAARPSTTERGYGADHRRRAAIVLKDATECCYCGKPPSPGDPFVACHVYAQSRGGPKDGPLAAGHQSCNNRAAAALKRKR